MNDLKHKPSQLKQLTVKQLCKLQKPINDALFARIRADIEWLQAELMPWRVEKKEACYWRIIESGQDGEPDWILAILHFTQYGNYKVSATFACSQVQEAEIKAAVERLNNRE